MSNFMAKSLLDSIDPERLHNLTMLQANGVSSEERSVVPDGGTNLSPQQLALLAFVPCLQQQVQQATPPTPKQAEETVSALAKPAEFSRPNSLLMFSPQKEDGGKQMQLNASQPKQLKINEATSNKPDISGELSVFPPRSPQSTSLPKPVPEQTSCIDLSLHPKQGGSSVQPRTTTSLPIFPASNSLALGDSSKLRQQLPQPQVQQQVLPPSTCQQLLANALAFPSYAFLQQLAAALSMPDAVSILTPVNAEQLQVNQALSEAQRQGRRRILFTPYQIGELLKCYKKNNYITPAEREQLARRINLTATQVKIWFQNHRYKIRRAGGKVFDEEASVTQAKVRAVEGSVPSANSWDSSLSEGYGNADSMQSQQGPQQTMPPLQQVPARQGAYMLATQKYMLKSLAQLLENQLNTKIDIRQNAEDEERKKCSELTKRVIGLLYEASAS
eukprot:TsM_001238800 transcript=TsM_001238800 gene=TsM_001238800